MAANRLSTIIAPQSPSVVSVTHVFAFHTIRLDWKVASGPLDFVLVHFRVPQVVADQLVLWRTDCGLADGGGVEVPALLRSSFSFVEVGDYVDGFGFGVGGRRWSGFGAAPDSGVGLESDGGVKEGKDGGVEDPGKERGGFIGRVDGGRLEGRFRV
jgi:hypothetical protein